MTAIGHPIIGYAGMTHLGLNSAVAAAQKGFRTVCFDPDSVLTGALQSGNTHINEPDLKEMLRANKDRLTFTSHVSDLQQCDVCYISLDVPTDDQALSDLAPVRAMIDLVNAALAKEALLVVLCQVPPGFTRSLPRAPQSLYYQVETLIFGRAMERALYPERYIIGCADPDLPIDSRLRRYLEAFSCPLLPMRYESAELAKTAINLFLAAQVCTANTLAEVCEKIGADWQEIIPSLRLDKRIGQHAYIETGLGLSGGNIERDLKTVSNLGYEFGAKVGIPVAYMEHSRYRKQWPATQFFEYYNGSADFKVGVLGLAYKINTHSVKNSPALELINALPNIPIAAYDPVVKQLENKSVSLTENAYQVAQGADIVFLMTPWDEFKALDWQKLVSGMRGKILIDPYRLIPSSQVKGFQHCVLGKA